MHQSQSILWQESIQKAYVCWPKMEDLQTNCEIYNQNEESYYYKKYMNHLNVTAK